MGMFYPLLATGFDTTEIPYRKLEVLSLATDDVIDQILNV